MSMKSVQVQLLESLGRGVRPFDTADSTISGSDSGFTELLGNAINGRAVTDLGVRFGPAVSGEYNEDEQYSIARAVDRAASVGVEHALILHNKRTLRVDVRNRMVLESQSTSDSKAITEIDGFVSSSFKSDTAKKSDVLELHESISVPARVVRNASLVHALAVQVAAID